MPKKLKIAHVTSSLKIGGAESLLVDLIRNLGQEHYEHHVIYFHDGPNRTRLHELGAATYAVKGLLARYDPVFWLHCARIIKGISPDVIHSSLWAANFLSRLIGKLYGIPTICAIHLGPEQDGLVRNALDRISMNAADAVVAISDTVASSLASHTWVPAGKVQVIKNGIDITHVQALNKAQRKTKACLGLQPEHFVIGSVGRFIPRKNYMQLIEVFAQLGKKYDHVRLLLVGFGQQEDLLRRRCAELGISNKVIFVIGQQAYGYYSAMDCFVLPSLQEGLSIALLEAMSCEVVCITTCQGNKHEVITDEYNGFVIEVNNPIQLLYTIERLITHVGLRERISVNACNIIKNEYELEKMTDSYHFLYSTLIQYSNEK